MQVRINRNVADQFLKSRIGCHDVNKAGQARGNTGNFSVPARNVPRSWHHQNMATMSIVTTRPNNSSSTGVYSTLKVIGQFS